MSDAPNGTQYSFGNPPPMGNAEVGAMVGVPPPTPQLVSMRDYRGDTLLQPFRMRERFQNKKPMMGFGMGLNSPEVARLLAGLGYDFIFIDWEHSAMGIKEITDLIRWVNLTSEGTCSSIVRVPTHNHCWISWAMDAGASAVILPHTDTPEQAVAAVNSARFYTEGGHRSYPPFSMHLGINDGDTRGAMPWDIYNRAAVICQIESKVGAENADAISAIEGVDGIMVGHMDLRFDLGLSFGGAMDEPEYVNAVSNILAAAKKNNDKPVLTFAAGPAACESYYKMGFRILMVGSDSMSLSAHSRQLLQSSHEMMRRVDKEAAAAPK